MVRDDLADQFGTSWLGNCRRAVNALGIAVSLHWEFTRGAAMSDIRDAIRSLARAKGFAIGAIATFALGIGVNLAVFSAVDRMLFRPLPYADADRLVVMANYGVGDSRPSGTIAAMDLVQARHLPAVAAASTSEWNTDGYRLTENPDGARYFRFVRVSYTTLRTLGLHPIIGQDFTEDDARVQRRRLLVSYTVWQHEFGGSADVVGRHIWSSTVGQFGEIVGVLPQDFIPPQISLPTLDWSGIAVDEETLDVAGPRDATTPPILRLKPGVTLEAAQAQIATIDARVRAAMPPPPPGVPPSVVRLVPLRDALFWRYETYVALIFAAATMVLLVGCANLASLLLVRARSREHRAALQLALGATAGRVVRGALVEALILALAGSAAALTVLKLSDHAIAAWTPLLFSKYAAPVLSLRVLVFTTLLATTSAVVAGVVPGWRAARVDVLSILQRGTGRIGAGPLRGSATMLAAEVAASLVLVTCAALAGRDLAGLLGSDLGFDPNRLYDVLAFLPPSNDLVTRHQQYAEMLDVVRAMPGVQAAGGADVLPVVGAVYGPMWVGDGGRARRWPVTDGLVEALGMRVIAGRTMSKAEILALAPVGMLSESGLRFVWPGVAPHDAIGRFLRFPGEDPRQVVGIVSDVRGAYQTPPEPSLYVPSGPVKFRFMDFAARLAPGASLTISELTSRLNGRGFWPQQVSISKPADRLDAGLADPKFRTELLSAFGLVALVLAAIGLYAVQSFSVALRTSEFGVRLSLGATPGDLRRMLTRQMLAPVVVGLAAGSLVTWWVAQFLQAFLTGVDARDPWTYAAVAASLLLVAVGATLIPARRAAKTDPVVALRAQ
jgi:predicted permease